MGDGAPVLVDDEDHGQAALQKLALAHRRRLLDGREDILERDDRDDRRHHFARIAAAHDGRGDGQCHLLTRTYEVRAADAHARPIHVRECHVDARVDLLAGDRVRLVSDVRRPGHGQYGERVEVSVPLDNLLESLVAPAVSEHADAARQLEGAGQARHHLAVTLPEQLDLPRLVLHELGLVAPLDRTQLVGAAVGEHPADDAEGRKPDDEQCREDDVEQSDAAKSVEHFRR